jgi:hypothetical protein
MNCFESDFNFYLRRYNMAAAAEAADMSPMQAGAYTRPRFCST